MALTATKLKQMPHDAPGGDIFARDENKDLFQCCGQEVEIYHVADDGADADDTITTGFEMVKGGYFFEVDIAASSKAIDVKPGTSPHDANITGLPNDAVDHTFIAVIFGYKVPNQLV